MLMKYAELVYSNPCNGVAIDIHRDIVRYKSWETSYFHYSDRIALVR